MNKKQKKGFTLAEVLITLAIIGVVAALTLPTMIANHQKKVYVVQLQKAISTLEQGFKMMMADDAVDKLEYTSVFQLCNNATNGQGDVTGLCGDNLYGSEDVTTKFFDAWKKYFNISQIATVDSTYKWYFLNSDGYDDMSDYALIQFADGMLADLGIAAATYLNSDGCLGQINIDVNGLKGPNTWGRDIFAFFIMTDGTLEGDGDGTKEKCTGSGSTGEYCSSYLMNNGWVMDY